MGDEEMGVLPYELDAAEMAAALGIEEDELVERYERRELVDAAYHKGRRLMFNTARVLEVYGARGRWRVRPPSHVSWEIEEVDRKEPRRWNWPTKRGK